MIDQNHEKSIRPKKGEAVFSTPDHPFNPSQWLGTVYEIDGDICLYKTDSGAVDRFIWRFASGVNAYHTWGAA